MFYDHLADRTPPTSLRRRFLCKTRVVQQSAKPINAPLFLKKRRKNVSLGGLMSFNLLLVERLESSLDSARSRVPRAENLRTTRSGDYGQACTN